MPRLLASSRSGDTGRPSRLLVFSVTAMALLNNSV
ncbi:uncharacterized protein METZ01_LOCUS316290, partial [marine metagenome]